MKKTLSEWIEWADNKPTTSTDTLINHVKWCKTHELAWASRTGQPVNYDQEITLIRPRTIRKTK